MKKATITYTAPPGESKTLEISGVTLLTGKSDTVICDDATMKRYESAAKGNPMLKVDGITDYTPPPKEAPRGDEPREHPKNGDHGKAHR